MGARSEIRVLHGRIDTLRDEWNLRFDLDQSAAQPARTESDATDRALNALGDRIAALEHVTRLLGDRIAAQTARTARVGPPPTTRQTAARKGAATRKAKATVKRVDAGKRK